MNPIPQPFKVEIQPDRERVFVRPVGDLDLSTAPELRKHVDEVRASGFMHVVLDMREVDFCDSSGLRLLAELDAESRGNGFLLELVAGGAVERIMELTGMRGLFRFTRPPQP